MGKGKPRRPTMTREEAADLRKQIIAANTEYLRLGDHPFWARLRHQLEVKGVDPYRAVWAKSERGLGDFEYGFVVSADRRVYQYTFTWEGTLHETGIFTEWQDITDHWRQLTGDFQGVLHRDSIALALEVLDNEQ